MSIQQLLSVREWTCWGLVSGCLKSNGDDATLVGVEIRLTVGCLQGGISLPRAAPFDTVAMAAAKKPLHYVR